MTVRADRPDAQGVVAAGGIPPDEPLTPVVAPAGRSQRGVAPWMIVDAHLHLADAAVGVSPGDTADHDLAGGQVLPVPRSVDPAGQLDRSLRRPAALGPV